MAPTVDWKRRYGSIDAAEVVRRFTEDGTPGTQLAKSFGVRRSAIYRILKAAGVNNRRGWRHHPVGETRVCTKCNRDLPLGAFATYQRKERQRVRAPKREYRPYCRECWAKWMRESGFNFTATTGLTLDQYRALVAGQDGVCAICRKPNNSKYRLGVDHEHATGVIRGLLCHRCNSRLEALDDQDWFRRAEAYVRTARTPYLWGNRTHNATIGFVTT